uniref:Uncharacterized protein n=1 Tax=Sphaerodactylus townsendi TaxID=933632 RepID=A0ACB8F3H7_9SAUR
MKMADAKQKWNEQLKCWIGYETDLEPPVVKCKKTKVKFDDGAVFLAACSSGDTEEVLRLLECGADINCANVDGLTVLHQLLSNLFYNNKACFLIVRPSCISQLRINRATLKGYGRTEKDDMKQRKDKSMNCVKQH